MSTQCLLTQRFLPRPTEFRALECPYHYRRILMRLLVRTDTESEPFEGEDRTPESPHTVAPPTCLVEESEGSGTFDARSTSSESTAPHSLDHPLTHTTPVLVPILHRTTRMVVRVSHVISPSLFAGMAEVAAMSDSTFLKSESGDVEDEDDESYGLDGESHGVDDESHGLDDKSYDINGEGRFIESDGLGLGEEEAVPEGQQRALMVVGTAVSKPLGLGYRALRRLELALEEDHVYSTFEVGQGFGSAPEPRKSERVSAFRQPTLSTWTDTKGGYDDHRLVHDMLLQQTALQQELQEMRDRVTVLEQERNHRER
nr:hypothetical protein [Tanacetum cinerariifolium]